MVKALTGFMLKPVHHKFQSWDLFLIYINDLPEGLITNAKLFANDTSLFSVARDIAASIEELNNDLRNLQ